MKDTRRLPVGTVTFLFTDIEGSTRLFQELGSAYLKLLEEHRRLVREAISRHHGCEVQTEGDGFFVAFARAGDAVAASLDAQLALTTHCWPDGAEIRVRMGVHTGEAAPSEGSYDALAVHQASVLARTGRGEQRRQVVANLNARVQAWWAMSAVFTVSLLTGRAGTIILFALISILALREFITLAPTSRGDHQALVWAFFVVTPLQYYLVSIGWYGLFSIMIPVYAFLFVNARVSLAGETSRFLERAAAIQWALMICVYCVSYAPALVGLDLVRFPDQGAKLLLFLVIVVQLSDVFQYIWGKLLGRHPVAPAVSPNKTWEGFVGGVTSAVLVGAAIWWATPFAPWQSAAMALLVAVMGFLGGLVMSAVKRDRGIKDFGWMIRGHGGVLDRIDSLIFAAPIFFHFVRFFFGPVSGSD
ncbi:MAG: phosphatidate cytidylyltransferase [Candidatus Dormibacteria bacterium]